MPGASPGRILRGLTGSLWQLAPARGDVGGLDDPDVRGGSDVGVNEYALASALFVGFAVVGAVAPFPLATLPHILGRRSRVRPRAFTWLAAVTCYCLKDAAERGRSDASTFVALRKGVRRASAIHLLLVAAKLCGADVGGVAGVAYYYKNAMACRNAAAASIVMHAGGGRGDAVKTRSLSAGASRPSAGRPSTGACFAALASLNARRVPSRRHCSAAAAAEPP